MIMTVMMDPVIGYDGSKADNKVMSIAEYLPIDEPLTRCGNEGQCGN